MTPPSNPQESRSGGTSFLYLAASAVAAAAVSIAAYRYGGGRRRPRRGRRREQENVSSSSVHRTSSGIHPTGRSTDGSERGNTSEDGDSAHKISCRNENERLQRAIEARDRDEVRAILRARNNRQRSLDEDDGDNDANSKKLDAKKADLASSATTDIRPGELDASQFSCPVCLQLLYKPCVNTCGHAFCFWCLHSAMSAVHTSSCPLCRNPFTQFASVLAPLQRFLCREFPQQMQCREEEVKEEEQKKWGGTQAPNVDKLGHAEDSRNCMVGSVDVLDLLCVHCRHVVSEPVVPACGHLVCKKCILNKGSDKVNRVKSEGSSCPECETPILDGLGGRAGELAVCSVLEPLLAKVTEMDDQKVASIINDAQKTKPSSNLERQSVSLSDQTIANGDPLDAGSQENTNANDEYFHIGIGCDGCGVYPITGRAYQCLDCPEDIGFDLCHSCFSRGVHLRVATGRFNQSHEASHQMREREQKENVLHMLKRARPDLTMQQIMQLIDLQFGAADEDEE